jgi:hypothetical protein
MLHSLRPEDFVLPQHLQTPWECPECSCRFPCGLGVVSLTHYRVGGTEEVRQGLACFCSTACLLRWEQPETLGLMQ